MCGLVLCAFFYLWCWCLGFLVCVCLGLLVTRGSSYSRQYPLSRPAAKPRALHRRACRVPCDMRTINCNMQHDTGTSNTTTKRSDTLRHWPLPSAGLVEYTPTSASEMLPLLCLCTCIQPAGLCGGWWLLSLAKAGTDRTWSLGTTRLSKTVLKPDRYTGGSVCGGSVCGLRKHNWRCLDLKANLPSRAELLGRCRLGP